MALGTVPGGFRPMLVGLHWPSKAWGDSARAPHHCSPARLAPSRCSVPTLKGDELESAVLERGQHGAQRFDGLRAIAAAVVAEQDVARLRGEQSPGD
jgi:hypothetical protein